MSTRTVRVARASEINPKLRRRDWGPWQLERDTYTLWNERDWYEVDLEECTTAASVLDWITQVAGKTWADPATLAGLVCALDDVLQVQASLCPSGRARQLSRRQIRQRVEAYR